MAYVRQDRKAYRLVVVALGGRGTTHASAVLQTGVLSDSALSVHWAVRNSSRTRSANRSTYACSNSARRWASRSARRARASASARHSDSAVPSAASWTSRPCRSYRLRAWLHFRTTADSVECFRAARQCRVLGREEDEVIAVSAGKAQGAALTEQADPRAATQHLATFVAGGLAT